MAKRTFPFDPKVFLEKIGEGKSRRRYLDNQGIFKQGDAADAVFYIQDGKVKLTVVSKRGKEGVIAIVEKGTFFGEGCLAGQTLRMSSASAIGEPTILRISKGSMVDVLHKEPGFAQVFIAYLLSRNIRIEEDLVDHLFNSSQKRLARLLLLLAHYGKDSKPEPVIAKVSQETLAQMIGTTRSHISSFMNKFRELGFIDYNGADTLEVHSSLLNIILHD